jgi:glycolate oxidase subunit GlcD
MTAPGATPALTRDLARLVGAAHVLAGEPARPYETDATASRGVRGIPDAVVLPADAAEVAAVVAWCCEHGVPLVPRGGGTGLAGGAVPVTGGVVLGLERLDRVADLSPERWRMTVGAGVRTATVHRLARENGLRFPPDPGAAEQSQIGGNVATNAGGPHAFKYGATGAWVTGLEAVVAPGEPVAVGGEARKDVGGYDIKSLLVGSEGTLGVITAVTLRLLPAPAAVRPVVAFFEAPEAGVACAGDVTASGLQPAALDYLDERTLSIVAGAYAGGVPDGAAFALLSELDGRQAEVDADAEELLALLAPAALRVDSPRPGDVWRWRDGVSGAAATERGGKVSEDIVVPPARLAEAIAAIDRLGAEHGLVACSWGHAGDGNVHASFLIDPADEQELELANRVADELFALAVRLGGGVTGEHGIGWVKRGQLARQWSPEAVALHERLKATFDPLGVLNPGKKLARPVD